jgi:hypothetical protein
MCKKPDQKGREGDSCEAAPVCRQSIQCSEGKPCERPDKHCEQEYGAGNARDRVGMMKGIDMPRLEEGIRYGERVKRCQPGTFQK